MRATRLELLRRRHGIATANDERIAMRFQSTAHVPTDKSSRYLQQLCKHWSHNLSVEFTPETGTIVFPRDARGADWPGDATLTLQAHEASLECRLDGSANGQLEGLKGVVARHLDRFAFREAPLRFDWQDA
ncbi:MAG: DUF2218 domain-containing protein [Dongiaceae bacterium]